MQIKRDQLLHILECEQKMPMNERVAIEYHMRGKDHAYVSDRLKVSYDQAIELYENGINKWLNSING